MSATKATTVFSLAVVKAYLDIPDDETGRDTLICQVADGVSEKFEAMTGRKIVTREGLTETWSGEGSNAHFLPFLDVTAITSLTIDGVSITPSDVFVDARMGVIRLKPGASAGAFSAGIGNCTVEYSAGLGEQDAETLPSDVVEALLEWAKALYDEKVSGATAATSVSIGPSSFVVKPGLGHNIRATIDAWKDKRA